MNLRVYEKGRCGIMKGSKYKGVNSLVFLLMSQTTDGSKLKRIPDYTWTTQIGIDYF